MEENKKEVEETVETTENANEILDKVTAETDRMEKANEEKKQLLDREEKLLAKSGRSEAGEPPLKKKQLSDVEYAEALERGEVNPMKEDGYI